MIMRATLAAMALAMAGCTTLGAGMAPAAACRVGEGMVETRLFLGLLKPGGQVSETEFRAFVDAEVVPRWKEGFTVLTGEGLWYSDTRKLTEREPSRVLVRLSDGSADASADAEAIRAAYIRQFNQDAVLRVDLPVCAAF